MNAAKRSADFRSRPPGHDLARGSVRFAAEVVAMVVTPLALWPHSIVLAVIAVLLLIGLPAVFSTPGDRPGGDGPVAVPGVVTIVILLLSLGAAVAGAWLIWPLGAAVAVTALCLTVIVTEQPRWRSLTTKHRQTTTAAVRHPPTTM